MTIATFRDGTVDADSHTLRWADPRTEGGADTWTDTLIDDEVMAEANAWLDAQLRSALPADPVGNGSATRTALDLDRQPDREHHSRTSQRARAGRLVLAVPAVTMLALFNVAVGFSDLLVARVFAVAFLLVVPGAVVLAASRSQPSDLAVRLACAAAWSMLYLMAIALIADFGLPLFSVDEPLARASLLILVDLSLIIMILVVSRRREPIASLLGRRLPTLRQVAAGAALAALPMISAAGAQAVDNGHGPAVSIAVLVACGLLLVGSLIAADRLGVWFLRATLFSVSLALIYSFTFSGDALYGWDIQQEFQAFSAVMTSNNWHTVVDQDPYRAMMSITVLPAALAQLSGVSGVSLLRGVYPVLFALFPVLVHVVAGRWLSKTTAFAAAALVVVQLAFAQQLPAIARQEIALLFFGVLVVVAFDDALPLRYRRWVVVVAGASLAFTHYSTAYVTSFAMLAAWALGVAVVIARREPRRNRVIILPVVIAVLGFTVFWNFGVTRSSDNVLRFADQVTERGAEFLPGGQDRSLVSRWLTGNAPQRISADEYARRVALIYDGSAPWLQRYPDAVVAEYPLTEASAPVVTGLAPSTRGIQSPLLVLASQGFVALTTIGMLLFAWHRRRDRSSARELAMLGIALLAFVAAMRVSGVAAEAYNQERAQIHTSVVLSVGFAASLAWLLSRWRRLTLVGLSGALAVLFLASSGLVVLVTGGSPSANLSNTGDARERFAITDAELASAQWLAVHRNPDSILFGDRYAQLRLLAAAEPVGELQSVLTPATLDRNAYVFATAANVVGGRARGAIGADYLVYGFPGAFLDANKARIYSTSTTAVYR